MHGHMTVTQQVAAVDEPRLHLWETGITRITRHPQAVGQVDGVLTVTASRQCHEGTVVSGTYTVDRQFIHGGDILGINGTSCFRLLAWRSETG